MYRKILHYRWHILEVVGGLAVGLLFVYVSIYVGRSNNFIDSYVPITIGIVSIILFLVSKKWIAIGLLSSYPISWAIIFMLVGIACGHGNCL
jgi:hypothetical protein